MITHDSTFEDLAIAPVKQTDVIAVRQIFNDPGYSDDLTMKWTSSNVLMSVSIDAVGEMLGSTTKKATVKLLGIVSDISVSDLFQIKLGLYDSSAFNYVSQGFFLVDTIDYDYDLGSTTVTMYDHMWSAGKTLYIDVVTSGDLEYPATVEDVAELMASKLNATLMSGFSSLPNASFEIAADLYSTISNFTLQNVIQEIAGATGTTVRMTDTTLTFSQYSVTTENLDSTSLKTLKIGNSYGPINSLVLGRVPQNDNVALFSQPLAGLTISSVNTATNLLTSVTHRLVNGDMVQFNSTGTLPSPLVANTSYYVYTNGQVDTFAVSPTYSQAIAGTGLIDITTAGTGTITIPASTTKEIQINNNEILDNDRAELIVPLYNALSGIYWSEVKSETVGLGWHEVGDVILFTQGSVTVRAFLNEVHLTLAGSIKETLVSKIPEATAINYQTAGGILKTIYNAEIKVDKQANQITSIVSEQQIVNDQVQADFTEIRQDVDSIDINIQNSGGNNLLLNSVGYAIDRVEDASLVVYDKLYKWDYVGINTTTEVAYDVATHGTVVSHDSSSSQNLGGVSGRSIRFDANYGSSKGIELTQRVNVAVGSPLSFATRVFSPGSLGTAKITLSNTNEYEEIIINASAHNWTEFKVENFTTSLPWLDVIIEVKAQAMEFTDLNLMYGVTIQKWTQADTELMSNNVQFTIDGIRVYDPNSDLETRITNTDFQTVRRSDGVVLFEADNTGVRANDFTIRGSSDYYTEGASVIKQITIPYDDPKGGIAFLKGTE